MMEMSQMTVQGQMLGLCLYMHLATPRVGSLRVRRFSRALAFTRVTNQREMNDYCTHSLLGFHSYTATINLNVWAVLSKTIWHRIYHFTILTVRHLKNIVLVIIALIHWILAHAVTSFAFHLIFCKPGHGQDHGLPYPCCLFCKILQEERCKNNQVFTAGQFLEPEILPCFVNSCYQSTREICRFPAAEPTSSRARPKTTDR